MPSEFVNVYFPWEPDRGGSYCLVRPTFALSANATSTPNAVLTAPRGELLWPSTGAPRDFDITSQPHTYLVAPTPSGILGALERDRDFVAISNDGGGCSGNAVAPYDARRFTGIRWLSAVESTSEDGVVPPTLFAVALNEAGTCFEHVAYEQDGRLALGSVSGDDLAKLGVRSRPCEGLTPPARKDYTAVFSRTAGGVFLVGGTSPNGERLSDVWFGGFEGSWQRVDLNGLVLGEVLGATYAFGDGRLWVVDAAQETNARNEGKSIVRLMRIDPFGKTDVVFSAPRDRANVSFFLSVDRDGRPLFSVSNPSHFSMYRVISETHQLHLVPDVSERVGVLARPPIVDPYGYSFVLAERGSLRLDRLDSPRSHASESDIWRVKDNESFARVIR